MTPRRARSNWSQKNVQHAERLIAQGHMQAPWPGAGRGRTKRWASAYAGSATMVMPEDFLAALQQDPAAHAFYATLKRQSLFTIYPGCTAPSGRKPCRSAWQRCWRS
nr:YdeI/OmpD-associated family protein [uncultured Albidiferax sp.]